MKSRAMFIAWLGITGLAVLPLVGCSQTGAQQTITLQSVLDDMSPNFETIALSHEQVLVRRARAIDTTARQFQDDLDNIFLTYRPLRLSVYAIP